MLFRSLIAQRAGKLEAALRTVIRGKDDVIRLALVSVLAGKWALPRPSFSTFPTQVRLVRDSGP